MAVYKPTYTDKQTGVQKESRVWWFEFTFAGKRVRESTKTSRKTLAVEAEKRRRLELERALTGVPAEHAQVRISSVREVLKAYASGYSVNHRKKSVLVVENRSVHLERLLGSALIPDLTPDRIVGYMRQRQQENASGRTINLELSVLSRAIGRTWTVLWPKLKKLSENKDVGRALESYEETAILAATTRSRSPLIYPFIQTLLWTGMRSDEARTLQWSQVDFESGHVIVGKSKTQAGTGRMIPMSSTLRTVLEHHASWYAANLGPIQPAWYVFPSSDRIRPTDATKPVTSLKRAWEGVRTHAKVECRLHDLRHSFCTKLAEAGVPEATMLDMMGHVSTAMLRRYSHIRVQARKDAIAALEVRSKGLPKESPKVGQVEDVKSAVTH